MCPVFRYSMSITPQKTTKQPAMLTIADALTVASTMPADVTSENAAISLTERTLTISLFMFIRLRSVIGYGLCTAQRATSPARQETVANRCKPLISKG